MDAHPLTPDLARKRL